MKKLAQNFPVPKSRQNRLEQPKPVQPTAPAAGQPNRQAPAQPAAQPTARPTPAASGAVKEMQQAMYEFGQTAMGIDAFKMGQSGQQQAGTGDYLGGHDPFSSFMFSNYLDTVKDKAGKAYVAVDGLGQKVRQQTSTDRHDIGNLRNWVDTIKHIGSPSSGGEYKADGAWGSRTNNGLKAIVDFSQMMFGFAKDMGVNLGEFPADGLQKFRQLIPAENEKHQVQGISDQLAQTMTSYIKTLTSLIASFKEKIMENSSWKDYISQDKPLFNAAKKLEGQDLTDYVLNDKNFVPLSQAAQQAGYSNLTLADLQDSSHFAAYLKRMNIDAETPEKFQQAVQAVKSFLDKGATL